MKKLIFLLFSAFAIATVGLTDSYVIEHSDDYSFSVYDESSLDNGSQVDIPHFDPLVQGFHVDFSTSRIGTFESVDLLFLDLSFFGKGGRDPPVLITEVGNKLVNNTKGELA